MLCRCGAENSFTSHRCPRCRRLLLLGIPLGQFLIDAAAGLLLVAAVALVFLRDRRTAEAQPVAMVQPQVSVVQLPEAAKPSQPRPLRLAITPPKYDDMGRLLATLGAGYAYSQLSMDDLLSPARLRDFDVVFITCGEAPETWVTERLGPGQRESSGMYLPRPDVTLRLQTALQGYVAAGGTLYASDWQYHLLALAFPDFIDATQLSALPAQRVQAQVVDEALRRQLGPEIVLRFDQAGWCPASFLPAKITELMRGSFRDDHGLERTAPLLVQFPFGQGSVIFTSFHNEAQNSDLERQLLRNLVFKIVTARTESVVKQTLLKGGFTAGQRSLLSASSPEQVLTQTYDCQGGRQLRFLLGFEDRGAQLHLQVTAPNGQTWQQTGASSFDLTIAQAAAGTWRYTVTAQRLPFGNFPFTLTVAEKQ